MPKLSEAQRTKFYNEIVAATSAETSEILASVVLDAGWDDVATRSDVARLRGEFEDLRGEFADLRGEFENLRGEFADLRNEFVDLRSEVRGEIAALRVELHDAMRNQIIWLVSTMIAIAGVVIAAGHLG